MSSIAIPGTNVFIPGTRIPRPDALNRKLVFGDRDQIAAIYFVEHILEQQEKDAGPQDGTLQQYRVTIEFTGDAEITVSARSQKEAEKIAADEFDMNDIDDFSLDTIRARIIKSS
jgi:hypothetical protein